MGNILYKFKSASKRKAKNSKLAKRLYRINTMLRVYPETEENYSSTFEDDDYKIIIKTNINKNTENINSYSFKSKIMNDKSLLIKTYLLSNFDYRDKTKKLEKSYFKSNYDRGLIHINIIFYPKRIESIGRFGVMQIIVPKKKQYKKKSNIKTKKAYVQIVRGGSCSGK